MWSTGQTERQIQWHLRTCTAGVQWIHEVISKSVNQSVRGSRGVLRERWRCGGRDGEELEEVQLQKGRSKLALWNKHIRFRIRLFQNWMTHLADKIVVLLYMILIKYQTCQQKERVKLPPTYAHTHTVMLFQRARILFILYIYIMGHIYLCVFISGYMFSGHIFVKPFHSSPFASVIIATIILKHSLDTAVSSLS